jgi:hypothetical protein
MKKWRTTLTTNPIIANIVGTILDIIDNCGYKLDGSLIDDGEKINAWIKTDDDIVVPFQFRYTTEQE